MQVLNHSIYNLAHGLGEEMDGGRWKMDFEFPSLVLSTCKMFKPTPNQKWQDKGLGGCGKHFHLLGYPTVEGNLSRKKSSPTIRS